MKKLIIFIFFLSFFLIYQNFNANALWILNDPPIPGPPIQSDTETSNLIIDGASDFLQSYSQLLLLLKESEKTSKNGFDFINAQNVSISAVKKLTSSKENYTHAVTRMKESGFDKTAIQKLQEFNYEGLTEQRKCHPDVMNEVSFYLAKGDILGLYEEMVSDLGLMLNSLIIIKNCTQENTLPHIEDLRALYQQYSDFMLKGYYTSLIFDEITNK